MPQQPATSRCIAPGGAAEAGDIAGWADLARREPKLARQTEVYHDALLLAPRRIPHGEIRGLDVAVEVP